MPEDLTERVSDEEGVLEGIRCQPKWGGGESEHRFAPALTALTRVCLTALNNIVHLVLL